MRLTVGPLPSAVYWRRRAVVLGALLLIIVVVYASCSGAGSGADSKNTAGGATSPPAPSATDEPATEATEPVLTPETGGAPGEEPGDPEPGSTAPAPPPQAPVGTAPCTDDEITITPVPAKSTVIRKTPVDLRLIIKNSSGRSCARDVGADLQELRIVKGAEMIWSSDHCGPQTGSDVRTLSPGVKHEFMITWNGRSSSKCGAGVPAGVVPAAGQYQLIGRLGTKHSAPVLLTLR